MAVSDNDTGDNDTSNSGRDNNSTPKQNPVTKQNPVRLTIGNYYCSNCGEGGLSRGDRQCPRCQDDLLWARVEI